MLLSKCVACNSQKSRFSKEQETSGLLGSLAIKALLSKLHLLGDILFQRYKMNERVNNFLLAGDTFIPEMHLRLNLPTMLADHLPKKRKNTTI